MEQFAWVCGDMPLTLDRFAQLFRLVLGEYDVGTIPVSLDRVTCGNIERACTENAKYVILLGVNDGLIPKTPSSTSLLSDMDRDKMDALGVELKAYGEERLLMGAGNALSSTRVPDGRATADVSHHRRRRR